MFADRYFVRNDDTNMCCYVILFFGLLLSNHADSAQSYQHGQSGHRLRRFAEIGGQRFDPALKMYWHVGIYSKRFSPYMQICGGTLVTPEAVISAAHCFWKDPEGVRPADLFAVGAGKQYRPWDEPAEGYSARKTDVAAIHIPVRYNDAATNYQEDIAVVIVAESFVINYHAIRPVCINFDEDFDEEQLSPGNKGVILGWGLTAEDGLPSQVLNYLKLPAVDIKECMTTVGPAFLRYLTSDKICAGVLTGKALCRGDSGGGLVFSDRVGSGSVPYLRGVASTAPSNNHSCNAIAFAALTHLRAHRAFIRRLIPDIEEYCEDYYPHAYIVRQRPSSIRNKDNGPTEQLLTADRASSPQCSCEENQSVTKDEPSNGQEYLSEEEKKRLEEIAERTVTKVLY